MQEQKIDINIKSQINYSVFINDKSIEDFMYDVNKIIENKKVLVVISEKVNKIYGTSLNITNSIKFVLKDGESEKNFKNYQKLLDFALRNKLERKDAIIAIGGGVVGDLAGFVASTYLRGIDFIQIPTTLLACVDSSVGGKTAINTKYGKNLVGTFYQPKVVLCNLNFLDTLDKRQYKTGLAEIIKYAFIEDSCRCDENYNLYDYLSHNIENIFARKHETLSQIIKISLELKKNVVSNDEKEAGLRRILNFGHTYAHAVEKITNYKKYTHGEAVVIGMVKAFDIANKLGMIDNSYYTNSIKFISKFAIVKEIPDFDNKIIAKLMIQDKKAQDGKINFILPSCAKNVETVQLEPQIIF